MTSTAKFQQSDICICAIYTTLKFKHSFMCDSWTWKCRQKNVPHLNALAERSSLFNFLYSSILRFGSFFFWSHFTATSFNVYDHKKKKIIAVLYKKKNFVWPRKNQISLEGGKLPRNLDRNRTVSSARQTQRREGISHSVNKPSKWQAVWPPPQKISLSASPEYKCIHMYTYEIELKSFSESSGKYF